MSTKRSLAIAAVAALLVGGAAMVVFLVAAERGASSGSQRADRAACQRLDTAPLRRLPEALRLFLTPGSEDAGRPMIEAAVRRLREFDGPAKADAADAANSLQALAAREPTAASVQRVHRALTVLGAKLEKQCRS